MLLIQLIIVVTVSILLAPCSARIACLEQNPRTTCHCDEGEKIIDCNSLGLTEFPRINATLKGYVGLTLAHNNIRPNSIPWEREILRKLPDLAVIDFRGIRGLNCDELQLKFERIHVMSSCEYDEETNTPQGGTPTTGATTTNDCKTLWCRVKARLEKTWLNVYAHVDYLWQSMKKKACNLVCRSKTNTNENSFENFSAKVRSNN